MGSIGEFVARGCQIWLTQLLKLSVQNCTCQRDLINNICWVKNYPISKVSDLTLSRISGPSFLNSWITITGKWERFKRVWAPVTRSTMFTQMPGKWAPPTTRSWGTLPRQERSPTNPGTSQWKVSFKPQSILTHQKITMTAQSSAWCATRQDPAFMSAGPEPLQSHSEFMINDMK